MRPSDLADLVAAHRARLLAAYRGEAGAEPWETVRASYGVGASDRAAELEAAAAAVAGWAATHLPHLRPAGLGEPDVATVGAQLDDLAAQTRRAAAPSPGVAGLGAIFANATANVGWWQERSRRAREVSVVRCRTCGARQERALVFDCAYCGEAMLAPSTPGEPR